MNSHLNKYLTIALGFVLAVSPLLRFSWDIAPQTLLHIIIIASFLVTVNYYQPSFSSIHKLFLVFFTVAIASFIPGIEKSNIRNELLVLADALLASYLFSLLEIEQRKKLLLAPVLIGLLFSVMMLFSFMQNPMSYLNGEWISRDFIVNPNVMGGYLALCLPLSFIFWNKTKSAALLSILIFFGILLTKSRTAIIVSTAVFIVLLLRNNKAHIRKIYYAIPAFSVILFCLIFAKWGQNSLLDRIHWWQSALAMFIDKPLTGIGWGNFANNYLFYRKFAGINTLYAHNMFFQIAAETGIAGIGSFIAITYLFYRTRHAGENQINPILRLAATGFLAVNFFDYSFHIPAIMILFFICVSSVLPENKLNKRNKPLIPGVIIAPVFLTACYFLTMPLLGSIYHQHGIYYMKHERFDDAETALNKSLQFDSLPSATYARLAEVRVRRYQVSGDPENITNALSTQKAAIERFPSNAVYWSDIGWLYRVLGDKENALNSAQNAVRYDSFNKRYAQILSNIMPESHR